MVLISSTVSTRMLYCIFLRSDKVTSIQADLRPEKEKKQLILMVVELSKI